MNETELVHKLMDMLESLTPGGSEFHNNPKMCVEWVRGRLGATIKIAADRNKLRQENSRMKNDMSELDDLLWSIHADFIDENDMKKARFITGKYTDKTNE